MLYLNCDSCYTGIYIYLRSLAVRLKWIHFIVYNLHCNKVDVLKMPCYQKIISVCCDLINKSDILFHQLQFSLPFLICWIFSNSHFTIWEDLSICWDRTVLSRVILPFRRKLSTHWKSLGELIKKVGPDLTLKMLG